ncbi:hypothetical protein P7C73_g4996, partial [Tremellales sp. Uapishka_1]
MSSLSTPSDKGSNKVSRLEVSPSRVNDRTTSSELDEPRDFTVPSKLNPFSKLRATIDARIRDELAADEGSIPFKIDGNCLLVGPIKTSKQAKDVGEYLGRQAESGTLRGIMMTASITRDDSVSNQTNEASVSAASSGTKYAFDQSGSSSPTLSDLQRQIQENEILETENLSLKKELRQWQSDAYRLAQSATDLQSKLNSRRRFPWFFTPQQYVYSPKTQNF